MAEFEPQDIAQEKGATTRTAYIDAENRISLPADWTHALGLHGLVVLERTGEGILVRPHSRATWDDLFATKLVIGPAPPDQHEDTAEGTGDDFLF